MLSEIECVGLRVCIQIFCVMFHEFSQFKFKFIYFHIRTVHQNNNTYNNEKTRQCVGTDLKAINAWFSQSHGKNVAKPTKNHKKVTWDLTYKATRKDEGQCPK